jgi:hypothetical protein
MSRNDMSRPEKQRRKQYTGLGARYPGDAFIPEDD